MKRVLCLWFPNWPIQQRKTALALDHQQALVLYSTTPRGQRVSACCRAARQRGVAPAMPLPEAQALWPISPGQAVRFELHDRQVDRQKLRELALWCLQFSPKVAIDDAEYADCLLLNATGCDYDFGGEEGLASAALAELKKQGYWALAAVADTIGTAWAVAHHAAAKQGTFLVGSSRISIVPPRRQAEALRMLPIEALRIPGKTVQVLHELNVLRVGQLLDLPRAELPSRFGQELLDAIDRALGAIPETLQPEQLAEPLQASWDFEDPVADGRILAEVFDHLLDYLLVRIPQQHGVQRLFCLLKPARGDPIHFRVERLRPTDSKKILMELVRLHIERLRLTAEVASMTVQAALILPLEFRQEELFGGAGHSRRELVGFLECLSSRLGERGVLRPWLEPDAAPECAYRYEPWLTSMSASPFARGAQTKRYSEPLPALGATRLTRPTFLKTPTSVTMLAVCPSGVPERFHWNGRTYDIERCWGPERIETGWWRNQDVCRDYYVVETTTGERFWLFRNLVTQCWFLQGIFA